MMDMHGEKVLDYSRKYRESLYEELKSSVKELSKVVSSIQDDINKGAEYLGTATDIVKHYTYKIDELQSRMYGVDNIIRASNKIKENFQQDKEKIYWYSYRLRGFSVGCQPKDFHAQDERVGKFGAIAYKRELTSEELEEYELDLLMVEEV